MDCQNGNKRFCNNITELKQLEGDLQIQYGEYISLLQKDYETFLSLIEDAFSTNMYIAFEGSIRLAQNVGVPTEEILDTPDKVVDNIDDIGSAARSISAGSNAAIILGIQH